MKRTIALILAVLTALVLCGCEVVGAEAPAPEGTAEVTVKHSKFIAFCSAVASDDDAEAFVKITSPSDL